MRRFWLVPITLFAALAVPADAVASPACSGPWVPTYRSAPGCPLMVVERDSTASPPNVQVWRNGALVADAMADIVTTNIQLDVDYYGQTCSGNYEVLDTRSESFIHHSIEVSNTQPGDEVVLDQQFGTVLIEEAGPCYPGSLPRPECYATQTEECPPPDPDDDLELGGCSTGNGSAGLPIVLLALGVLGASARRGRLASRPRPRSRPSSSRDPRRARSARSGES